jgi:hypothetical protein
MCLNLPIGAGSITVIGRLLRDVQNASEAAYIGFAEAKALLLVLVLAIILRQIGAFGAVLDKGCVFSSELNYL